VRAGFLIRRLPGVYAVGHAAPSLTAELTAALLYAGPNAMLSHATAAWWVGLADYRPAVIHVSTPRRCAGLPGIVVHDRRALTRSWHRELPVTPVGQLLLDLANHASAVDLRRALANAEYHGLLELDTLEALLGQGRAGTAALRAALEHHQPQLARTRSELERALLSLCERECLPVPDFNVWIEGFLVDAVWRQQRVIVEVDGRAGHSSWARIRTDRRRDLVLRRAGCVPLRYVWEQVTGRVPEAADDLRAALSSAEPSAARESR
jgi:very-short-patch-repair endonuclease